jgi:hypothetical protein
MTDLLPALRPHCAQHGPMELRLGFTPEQRWCGTWYGCAAHRCQTAVLLPSDALLVQLSTQGARS